MCFFLPSNGRISYEDDRKLVLFPRSNGIMVFFPVVSMGIQLSVQWSSKNFACLTEESGMGTSFEVVIVTLGPAF